jgi:hypothetical protein
LANHFIGSHDRGRSEMNSIAMVHQIHTYSDLRRQIHEDLRSQHPEWIQPNGESPLCDSYEARLMKTLQRLNQSERSNSFNAIATTWSNDGGG